MDEYKMKYKDNDNTKYAVVGFLAIIIFVLIYKVAFNQCNDTAYQDIKDHLQHAQSIYLNSLKESWLERPYLFWHLCVKGFIKFCDYPATVAAACTCGVFAILNYLLTFFIANRTVTYYVKRDVSVLCACAAAFLSIVQPFYVPWFNEYHYEGQFSINPIFNPTHMAVKPIGLFVFALAIDIFRGYKCEELLFFKGKRIRRCLYVLFGSSLLLSTFTKPTFMYMFIPTGVIFLSIECVHCIRKKDGSIKKCWDMIWKMGLMCIPSLLYLCLEYTAFYIWGGTDDDAHIAISGFMYAWKIYSPNVFRSIIYAMAFPLWMVIMNPKYFIKSIEGRLGVIAYIVGALEFSFFVETGVKLTHLNFSWSLMSGMLLFWIVAMIKLIELTKIKNSTRWNSFVVLTGWLLITIHLFSGLYYINPTAYII